MGGQTEEGLESQLKESDLDAESKEQLNIPIQRSGVKRVEF